ncbi:RloB family protein [Microbispora sp. H10836]|uniref:RloB family protein n=1 Tax=Microbispora sp. H10836 TaxID=2729106 RepID=UPI0014731EF9|nr:RloB family protein [Microbispora sp. H10836]
MSPRQPKNDNSRKGSSSIARRSLLERRPSGTRAQKKRFLILCEGETEERYFQGMRTRGGPVLDVINPKVDHVNVVVEAHRRRCLDDYDDGDEVWCVLDTELDRGLADRILAKAGGTIRLALSTPCFDFWLLLHREDRRAPFQTAGDVEKALKRALPGWSKGSTKFADFRDGVDDACRRARAVASEKKDHMRNPSTSVWRLVEAIRGSAGGGR